MKQRLARLWLPVLLMAVFFAAMAYIQFSTPDLADNDGFYHIKMAWLMRTQGLKPAFPWLPLTILNPREFYDHHFLFHVLMIPFTFGDLVQGAKWAAVTFACLAFLAVWYLFRRQRIPFSAAWALGLLAVSEAFLYRMSIPRAQSLSLAVLALAMAWMLEGRYLHLAALGFLYVWLYDAFPLIIALAALHVTAIAVTEHRWEPHPLLYVTGGVLLGMLVNPYFPYNVIFAYRHMLPKLADATAISVGNEWYPYSTAQLLQNSLPALVGLASGIFALGLAGRRMDTRTAVALLASLFFALMLFQARRFVEYFPPFALIFAAFAWSPFFSRPDAPEPASSRTRAWQPVLRHWPSIVLCVAVLSASLVSVRAAGLSMRDSKPFGLYAGASAWLTRNTPSGSAVFQTDWDDFPRLFFYDTHNTYLIGLDPSYLQLADPPLYDLWVKITQGKVTNLSEVIPARFGARYIHTDLAHTAFLAVAAKDAGLREVYRDGQAVLFEVAAP